MQIEVAKVTYSGTTAECFIAFNDRHRATAAREFIAKELGVTYQPTYQRWLSGGLTARGITLIRVRAMLELFGYKCSEWQHLKPSRRVIAQIIGLGVMGIGDVRAELRSSSEIISYGFLLDDTCEMSPQNEWLAQQFAAEYYPSLERATTRFWGRVDRASASLIGARPDTREIGMERAVNVPTTPKPRKARSSAKRGAKRNKPIAPQTALGEIKATPTAIAADQLANQLASAHERILQLVQVVKQLENDKAELTGELSVMTVRDSDAQKENVLLRDRVRVLESFMVAIQARLGDIELPTELLREADDILSRYSL